MNRIAVLIASLLSLSCNSTYQIEPGDTFNLSRLNAEYRTDARSALCMWNDAIPEIKLTASAETGVWSIVGGDVEALTGHRAGGFFDPDAPEIVIDPDFYLRRETPDQVAAVIAHEIGHALGIKDHLDRGLMRASGPWSMCVDDTTAAELLRVRPDLTVRATCPGSAMFTPL